MSIAFFIIVLLTIGSAAVALSLRNLIHSALLLIGTWAGIAVFYLWAGSQFLAFAQILVYIGAVSMIVLFAVLLTRHSRQDVIMANETVRRALAALAVGGAVLGVLIAAVLRSPFGGTPAGQPPALSVREIGQQLAGPHAASLLIVGVLLTVALIGAVVIAATEPAAGERRPPADADARTRPKSGDTP